MEKSIRGFTIVELLIVIVVIAVLASISIVAYNGIQSRAARTAVQSSVTNIGKQLAIFNVDSGTYPTSITNCPTPTTTTLCIQPSGGETLYYRTSAATNEPDIEVASMNGSQFYYEAKGEAVGPNEFLRYANIAPFIDKYGYKKYRLEFDMRSTDASVDNITNVYMQNGSGAKYGGLGIDVTVSNSWQHYDLTFTPSLNTSSLTESWLAFYGTYSTGNRPVVDNVKLSLAP